MADLEDLNDHAQAAGLACDRAVFTSVRSPTGEGYRLVAWSVGVKPEERAELTRRAPSHGSLCAPGSSARALIQFTLQSTGRFVVGVVRIAGAEASQRGGGRVWTDFLLTDTEEAHRQGLHPQEMRRALETAGALKLPLGRVALEAMVVQRGVSVAPAVLETPAAGRVAAARDARSAQRAAVVASLLVGGSSCVIGAGEMPVEVFEDALHMIPASWRTQIEACAGLLFSPSRGVKASVTIVIDTDTTRRTRGQGVECINLETNPPPLAGPLLPWLTLMSRWWTQDRAAEAIELADKLTGVWSVEDVLAVAALCESIDRNESSVAALDQLLQSRRAA